MTKIKEILNNWINNNIINENDIPEILKVYSKFFSDQEISNENLNITMQDQLWNFFDLNLALEYIAKKIQYNYIEIYFSEGKFIKRYTY